MTYYTAAEAAQLLRCKPLTVRRWCASGKLRASKPGGAWVIPASAVDRLLRRHAPDTRLWDIITGSTARA